MASFLFSSSKENETVTMINLKEKISPNINLLATASASVFYLTPCTPPQWDFYKRGNVSFLYDCKEKIFFFQSYKKKSKLLKISTPSFFRRTTKPIWELKLYPGSFYDTEYKDFPVITTRDETWGLQFSCSKEAGHFNQVVSESFLKCPEEFGSDANSVRERCVFSPLSTNSLQPSSRAQSSNQFEKAARGDDTSLNGIVLSDDQVKLMEQVIQFFPPGWKIIYVAVSDVSTIVGGEKEYTILPDKLVSFSEDDHSNLHLHVRNLNDLENVMLECNVHESLNSPGFIVEFFYFSFYLESWKWYGFDLTEKDAQVFKMILKKNSIAYKEVMENQKPAPCSNGRDQSSFSERPVRPQRQLKSAVEMQQKNLEKVKNTNETPFGCQSLLGSIKRRKQNLRKVRCFLKPNCGECINALIDALSE